MSFPNRSSATPARLSRWVQKPRWMRACPLLRKDSGRSEVLHPQQRAVCRIVCNFAGAGLSCLPGTNLHSFCYTAQRKLLVHQGRRVMCKSEKSDPETQLPPESLPGDEELEKLAKQIHVHYQESPAKPPPEKNIHQRRTIPPVPEGEEVQDESPSPPVDLE